MFGINASGQIVGTYYDSKFKAHGFLCSGGGYVTLDDPLGVNGTVAKAINDAGVVVGYYTDANQVAFFETALVPE